MSISGLLRVTATAKRIPATMTLREVGTWAYAPQAEPDQIHFADIDMAVVDYSTDGTDEGSVSPEELRRMKYGFDGSRRLVLCRLSVGVADPRRPYWPRHGAPSWAIGEWRDGYAANLLSADWRSIVIQETRKIRNAGFDGVFLDCDYILPVTIDMADLVWRVRDQIGDLTLVVANGEHMVPIPGFLAVADGLARIGLYTTLTTPDMAEVEDYLMQADDKPVFVLEFTEGEEEILWARRCVSEMGWNPCIVTPSGPA